MHYYRLCSIESNRPIYCGCIVRVVAGEDRRKHTQLIHRSTGTDVGLLIANSPEPYPQCESWSYFRPYSQLYWIMGYPYIGHDRPKYCGSLF